MTNQRIILASSSLIVFTVLFTLNPSMLTNIQAQIYDNQYEYDNNYYQDLKSSQKDNDIDYSTRVFPTPAMK